MSSWEYLYLRNKKDKIFKKLYSKKIHQKWVTPQLLEILKRSMVKMESIMLHLDIIKEKTITE
jgi:hypothetical protein